MQLEGLLADLIELKNIKDKQNKYHLSNFVVTRKAMDLAPVAKARAEHHRSREKHYTIELENKEKHLRENGVKMQMIDPKTGGVVEHLASGGTPLPSNFSNYSNANSMPTFEAKVDKDMLSAVEQAKTKMLQHRAKAEQFDKYVQAFLCEPNAEVMLSVDDVSSFDLKR